jgi:hypothetical protein
MSRGLVLAAVGLVLGATGASASSGDVWKKLHRPLHMPKVARGAECPISKVDRRFDFEKYGVGEGVGAGPAYPIRTDVLIFDPNTNNSEFAGSRWSGAKVLWFVSPRYRRPVLIRGRRLDRPDVLRFDRGKVPPSELRIPSGSSVVGNPGVRDVGQRYRPSYTRLRESGCYAYQVDGTSFSYTVVFRAARSAASPVPPAPPADVWKTLHRPLQLPALAAGQPCPVSAVDQSFDFGRYGVVKGIGPGPAWPIGFEQPGSVLRFTYPPPTKSAFYGSEWSGNKVLWFTSLDAIGPFLIRGRRLDAPDVLRFDEGTVPPTEMRLRAGRPSYTRVRAPGCYAYQVDGPKFSYPVVFRAELSI